MMLMKTIILLLMPLTQCGKRQVHQCLAAVKCNEYSLPPLIMQRLPSEIVMVMMMMAPYSDDVQTIKKNCDEY